MPSLIHDIRLQVEAAITAGLGPELRGVDPLLRPAADAKFGDYQANVAMSLGKQLGRKPREVAEAIKAQLDLSGFFEHVEVAGPGFINLTLASRSLGDAVAAMAADAQLGVEQRPRTQRVVVDYSSPNVAKQMHVGHLRSTIIGDAIARVLAFHGDTVIRQNHVGDWGTQFGMLIENLIDEGFEPGGAFDPAELTRLYQAAKKRFDDDANFTERARQRVVKLQAGDAATVKLWQALVDASRQYFQAIYARLDVLLTDDDIRGESFYNDRLPAVVERLVNEQHAIEDAGALVVYPEGFTDRDGHALGMIVRKSDGGYLYATTDLAAAMFRVQELKADRVIYVIGVPQRQHFEMFSTTLRQAGWIDETVRLDFVGFGSVLGADRKMFKTRSGDTVRLADLISEAEQRALQIVTEKNPDMPAADQRHIAHVVGVGALKYADLSSDRIKDYTFDWDRMLAFDGNTAPYLQNAYVRIQSIFRKAPPPEVSEGSVSGDTASGGSGGSGGVIIADPAERTLALKLLQFPGVVDAVVDSLEPHRLCTYLYELAQAFHAFYEKCPVLNADDDATRRSRLSLCDVTASTLKTGLGLLGIGVVEQM